MGCCRRALPSEIHRDLRSRNGLLPSISHRDLPRHPYSLVRSSTFRRESGDLCAIVAFDSVCGLWPGARTGRRSSYPFACCAFRQRNRLTRLSAVDITSQCCPVRSASNVQCSSATRHVVGDVAPALEFRSSVRYIVVIGERQLRPSYLRNIRNGSQLYTIINYC